MTSEARLLINHGGAFVWAPHLLYVEGELREVTVIPDELNLFDLKDTIIGLGYSEQRIGKIYFARPNLNLMKH